MQFDDTTDWEASKKGNLWRMLNGVLCVVGKRRDGSYWARHGSDFVSGRFTSLEEAKAAANCGQASDLSDPHLPDGWWG